MTQFSILGKPFLKVHAGNTVRAPQINSDNSVFPLPCKWQGSIVIDHVGYLKINLFDFFFVSVLCARVYKSSVTAEDKELIEEWLWRKGKQTQQMALRPYCLNHGMCKSTGAETLPQSYIRKAVSYIKTYIRPV